jgi:DNA-binding PadR family transcriptional regulator
MKAELLILGVLHREDMHPYEIKRRLQAAMVECYLDIDVGTLYYAVRQLAKEGHIAVRGHEQVVRGGERTTYGLTDSGRARFQTLMLERFADRASIMHPNWRSARSRSAGCSPCWRRSSPPAPAS